MSQYVKNITLDQQRKIFKKIGYCKIDQVFDKIFINQIKDDINKLKKKGSYKDRFNKLRRIEKIYNKTENLKKLNSTLKKLIFKILKKKLEIFKDKCNLKPPGGAGFKAHYDGTFYFLDKKSRKRKGWYEYSNYFVNALVALDTCNKKNGTIEISNFQNKKFEKLLLDTNQDGSPELTKSFEKKLKFKSINLLPGDVIFFSNKCPHKSKKNNSNKPRMILYYTYSNSNIKSYNKYFKDKDESLNKNSKSLNG
jgi:ectoine hydroxylase-related dioxygenase (phytanoyl-CoA dioxygenase family)